MIYLITFLEGFISFISPCMLPMLPLYISYFAGGEKNKKKVFINSISFVVGFTVVFCILGLFAGTLGSLLSKYHNTVNIVCGIIIIIFGLSYLKVFNFKFLKGMKKAVSVDSLLSAFLFGIIYSVSLTPCIGAFLGSALMMASASGTALKGVTLLFLYSLGLGIPFIASAVLIQKLSVAFNWIKNHYNIINTICGIFLIIIGVIMILGYYSSFLKLFL